MVLQEGDVLDGKFTIQTCISSGGMGEVYKGVDLDLSRAVAIKILTKPSEELTDRFIREAQSMAALDHPNIVPIYGIGTHDGFHYFVMKFIVGQTLETMLKRQRLELDPPFEIDQVVALLCATFKALDHAHRRGILHRDIKPGNIMIDVHQSPILMDFGIVKRLEDARVTQTGVIFGTPQYMSPEQAMGQDQTPRTDIYGLGVIAFEMLANRLPFVAETLYTMLLAHVNDPAPDVREFNPLVPDWLAESVDKMLKKQEEDRFSSANEVVKVLESGLQNGRRQTALGERTSSLRQIPIVIEKRSAADQSAVGRYDGVVTKRKNSSVKKHTHIAIIAVFLFLITALYVLSR